jgi:hypothetical protein
MISAMAQSHLLKDLVQGDRLAPIEMASKPPRMHVPELGFPVPLRL